MDGANITMVQSALLEPPPRRGRSSKSEAWLCSMKQGLRTLHDMATCARAYHSSVGGDGVCDMIYLAPSIDFHRTINGHVRRASYRL